MFGFAFLKSLLGDVMGDPLECEHANPEMATPCSKRPPACPSTEKAPTRPHSPTAGTTGPGLSTDSSHGRATPSTRHDGDHD